VLPVIVYQIDAELNVGFRLVGLPALMKISTMLYKDEEN
jgi:hypothetical protein